MSRMHAIPSPALDFPFSHRVLWLKAMSRLFRICVLVALLFNSADTATADALVRNQAMQASTILEAYLVDGALRVEIEVSFADLPAFADLLPDELSKKLGNAPEPHADRMKRFFERGLTFQAGDRILPGRLVLIEPRDRTRRDPVSGEALPLGAGEEPEKALFFVLEYELEGTPETLAVASLPRMPAGGPVSIGFVFYHLGVAVNDFRYLTPGLILDLDWEDPWHSRFRQKTMKRAYDAPLNVFLYAEPYEVRVEVVVRPLDLQAFVDLGLEGRDKILPDDYGTIKERVATFLAETFQLEIDGEPAEPVLDRVHFLRRTLKSSTVIDPPEELSVFNAQLGVIYIVPRTRLPKEAKLTWSIFPDKIALIPAAATDEAGPLPSSLDRDDPVLVWTNYLKNPSNFARKSVELPPAAWLRRLRPLGFAGLVTGAVILLAAVARSIRRRRPAWVGIPVALAILAGSWWALQSAKRARIDSDQAREIVGTLLYNVYRSFDFRQEEAVYDMLAESVSGPLLAQTYLETRRGLVLQNQGGARAKVNKVAIEEIVPTPLPDRTGFLVDVSWVVGGSVGHWGHIHQRRNRYGADLTVEPLDGTWKITGMNVRSEERTQ